MLAGSVFFRSSLSMYSISRCWRRVTSAGLGMGSPLHSLVLFDLGQGIAVAAGPAEGAVALDDAPETGAAEYRAPGGLDLRSEEHTSELQSRENLVCRLLLEKK